MKKINYFQIGGTFIDKYNPKQKSTLNTTIDYFRNKGWSDESIAGVLSNFQGESEMKPDTVEVGGKGYGIAQFTADTRNHLFDLYGNHPTLEQQLEYIDTWKNGKHKKWHFKKDGKRYTKKYNGQVINSTDMNYQSNLFRQINSTNPQDYTLGFLQYFERPANIKSAKTKRLSYLPTFVDYLRNYKTQKPYKPYQWNTPLKYEPPLHFPIKVPFRKLGGTLLPKKSPIQQFKEQYKKK